MSTYAEPPSKEILSAPTGRISRPPPYQDDTGRVMSYQGHEQAPEVSTSTLSSNSNYSASTYTSTLSKPIVVPQLTNIFFVKTFSPFSRCYPPALASLTNPISQEEFLEFVDGLNNAFLASTLGLAAHMAGGMMMGAQGILPVQAVGAGIQILSLVYTAGTSFIKVRSYLKKTNQAIFAPRGLVVQVVTTKKMMAAIGCPEEKLKLPPLENLDDLKRAGAMAALQTGKHKQQEGAEAPPAPEDLVDQEDPRLRRLRALEDIVSPLSFDVPEKAPATGFMQKFREKPLQWVNDRQQKKADKARINAVKKHTKKNSTATADSASTYSHPYDEAKMAEASGTGAPLARVGTKNTVNMTDADREAAMAEVREVGGKKLEKLEKKEEKVANRILWILITRLDGQHAPEDYLDVPEDQSDEGSRSSSRIS